MAALQKSATACDRAEDKAAGATRNQKHHNRVREAQVRCRSTSSRGRNIPL